MSKVNHVFGNIQVFHKDLPSGKDYNRYKSLCLALRGDGWRIPTIQELTYLYGLHELNILGFNSSEYYFSSTNTINSIGQVKDYTVKCIYFGDGSLMSVTTLMYKKNFSVRPVRSINI
jgi:hypothetical protein